MLLYAVPLDSSMSAADALSRLARNGLWLDSRQPQAHEWISARAPLFALSFEEAAQRAKRDPARYGAAIRRQVDANILWYAAAVSELLRLCAAAQPTARLVDVLNLHETDSVPEVESPSEASSGAYVVAYGGLPTLVNVTEPQPAAPPFPARKPSKTRRSRARSGGGPFETAGQPFEESASSSAEAAPSEIRAWPRLEAPEYVRARMPFTVVVGLSASAQPGVAGSAFTIAIPEGADSVDVTVELTSDGFDAPEGWTRLLKVPAAAPTSPAVTFALVGRDPEGVQPMRLTMLEVRYLVGSTVCGYASKPIIVGAAGAREEPPLPLERGASWRAQPASATPVVLSADPAEVDLTVELAKPDRNPAKGRFICTLRSPHQLATPAGPFEIDLGEDAKTFASTIIDGVRQHGGTVLGENFLASLGSLVSEKLPVELFDALQEVARIVAPAPPAVLIVSAEPFVPWELATVDPPLDSSRPHYLGAQVLLGRWLREGTASRGVAKPSPHPPGRLAVDHLAVMAGKYKAASGLRDLPSAEEEARDLVKAYGGIGLPATAAALKQLLDAELTRDFETVAAGAVHFAGHGQFNSTDPDSSVMFLSDGSPISSLLFRSASYGGDRQPLIFLNACMIGVGGELLGDMGGFPGNCLRGGFGAVLGALWAIDDDVASEIARAFWSRALPPAGSPAEPVGAILRDLRQQFGPDSTGATVPTYLAYAYYGHPRLQMHRVT
jgi:hypothetical protein